MAPLRYSLAEGRPPQVGLIALQADETIEADLHRLKPVAVELLVSRVPSGTEVSVKTLQAMTASLTTAASLFPRGARLSAVGYGCTSGAAHIGASKVAELIRAGVETARVTDPMTALVAACRALNIARIGMLTPYVPDVSRRLCAALEGQGIKTSALLSFEVAEEAAVVRIDAASVIAGAVDVAEAAPCDALFLSCTNLRTLDVIDEVERRTGLPVLSSNQVLGWHLFSGYGTAAAAPGRLWRTAAPA